VKSREAIQDRLVLRDVLGRDVCDGALVDGLGQDNGVLYGWLNETSVF